MLPDQTIEELAADLRKKLKLGQFQDQGRLPSERKMAEMLAISRTRLRLVLDTLEADGVVFRRQGQGTFVTPPPATDAARLKPLAQQVAPQDVMEVRLELEPALAALAAQRATERERRNFALIAKATQKATDQDAYEAADDLFHYRIAEMAHNPLFLAMYEAIRSVRSQTSWTETRAQKYSPETLHILAGQHRELAEAILSKEAEEAARAMSRHLETVAKTLLTP